MSQTEEQQAARDDKSSRPAFETTLRGYDKRQVDLHISRLDREASRLAAENERGRAQFHDLSAQLQQAHVELTELRQRPPQVDRASFRHLGPMVDQILALAEKQAEAIVSTTAQRAAQHQAEAEKVLADARDEADAMRAEGAAAQERAEQEAQQTSEQTAQQAEQARAQVQQEVEAARAQVQQEVEAARTQAKQELAQWKAAVERDITEQRAAAEQELTGQRNTVNQKNAALHAEAQQYSADLRRRADEQAASHQQQLTVVQQEILARRQALAQLQAELETNQQQLGEVRQEGEATETELLQLQERLREVNHELSAQLNRLEGAKRASESAERHAKDVRAKVQREAERVATLAAAAVMAAAAGGAETGEYHQVVPTRTPVRHAAEEVAETPADPVAVEPAAAEPVAVEQAAPEQPAEQPLAAPARHELPSRGASHARREPDPAEPNGHGHDYRHGNGIPAQREPQRDLLPDKVTADAE